ncbi:MAG: InlB B-repeat-containing protein [Bacilli bacterium]
MKKIFLILSFITLFMFYGCSGKSETELTITFNANGGIPVTSITDFENESITKPIDPTKNGFIFDGWFHDEELNSAVTWPHKLVENATFYAKWSEDSTQTFFSITWEVNGTIVETDPKVLEGTVPEFNGIVPTKESTNQFNYAFSGWSPLVVAANKNQTYVAIFSETVREFIIDFDENGGSSVGSISKEFGTQISAPSAPVREGYVFISWCLDNELTQEVTWPITVVENITIHAKWNEVIPYGDYLSSLLLGYELNPYNYIPAAMKRGVPLINEQMTTYNLSNATSISNIPFGGFGEQWHMVITNIEESIKFLNVLNVVETITGLSIVTFNNYLDENPANFSSFEFEEGIYKVTIIFEEGILYYVLEYTTTVPIFGEQTIQIALSYDINTHETIGRIQIGDSNALRYQILENSFSFGIKYLGVRRAYFEVSKDQNNNVEGHIFEFLELDGVYSNCSTASFYIEDTYAYVVGNKSKSMIGWEGTITEVYEASTGLLLGYEVMESLNSIIYNTIWFNLKDASGFSSIKIAEAPIENSNPYLIYINGSDSVFQSKTVGGISVKTFSRRFDVELRTQYFYYLDNEVTYEVALDIPMLFVQEENLSTIITDLTSVNPDINFNLLTSQDIQDEIMAAYDELTGPFIIAKEEVTSDDIVNYIGDKFFHVE